MLIRVVGFLSCLAVLVSLCAAQGLGSISGKVVDTKGVPVPAATVRVSSLEPGPPLQTITEIDGTFSFTALPSTAYSLEIEMPGFEKLRRAAIDPSSAASSGLILTLVRPQTARAPEAARPERGDARAARATARRGESPGLFQEVEFLGPPSGEESQPSPTAAGGEIGSREPREDNSDLLLISGNTVANIGAGDWNDPRFRERIEGMAERMGFAGGRDGFGPAGRFGGGGGFGEGGGGGIRGFGGPGGRGLQQRLNGNLNASYRNSALNARPYSIKGSEVPKPLQIQNNFGASVGGLLPWGGRPTQTRRGGPPGMWFFSYEGSRNRNPYDSLTTVPTELERAGDFSQTSLRAGQLAGRPIALFDPAASTRVEFPGGRIPASRMNSASLALLEYFPLPNLPGSVQNFTIQRGLINTSDSISARVNARLGSKDNVFASYSARTGVSLTSQIFPGLDTERSNRSHNVAIGGVHRFQPRLIMNYRINFNHVRTLSSNSFAFSRDIAGELGIQGVSREPINFGIPNIQLTNYGDLQLGNPSLNRTQTIAAGGGINKIGRKHSIQSGVDVSWNQRNSQLDPNARGAFEFTGFATSAFDAQGRPLPGTGYDFADFLLGFPYATSRRYGSSNNYLRARNLSLFVQDNWRVRGNLTISLGLRYEYVQPFHEKYDRMVSLDVAPGFADVAQVFPGQQGPYSGKLPRSLLHGDKNNLAPRIGIAWKPSTTSKLTYRVGYGLFYNPSVYPYIAAQLVGQPPFATSQNILTTLANPLTLQNGFPVDPNVTIRNSYSIDPNYRIGYVHQWNLNIQAQLFRIYTLEVGYNGSKGTRLDILRAPNRAPSGSSPGSTEGNRIISNAENFVYQGSGANSILHGMRIRLNRRFSKGFRMENSYTLAKSIDNASGVGGGALLVVQDEQNVLGERSLSSFDRRHRFDSEFSFDLPFGDRRRYFAGVGRLAGGFISGWTLTGEFEANSGTPLTPRILGNLSNNSGTGSNSSERPDATAAEITLPRDQRTTSRYFNTLAFSVPAPGRFGNAGRYTIPGPGSLLLNMSLRKGFRLDDSNRRLELRWQVSNVFNHPNFGGVGTVINALNFGRVTSARAMRQMQFNLRLSF